MSLRHVEEGLTALSYPHVAYYLRGEQGYGRPRPSWLDEGDMPLHKKPLKEKPVPRAMYGNAGAAAASGAADGAAAGQAAGESAADGAGGFGGGFIAAIAGAVSSVANAVASFEVTKQAKEMTKQTRAQTEAQRDIAESAERTRKAEAAAQVEINRNLYLIEMERMKGVPLQLGAGLAGVIILAVVFAPPQRTSKKTGSVAQTQKRSQSGKTARTQRKAQRSL